MDEATQLSASKAPLRPARRIRTRIRLTRQGAVVLLLLGGFLVGALNTGTNLLYFVSAVFVTLFLVNTLLAWGVVRGATVTRVGSAQVVRGEWSRAVVTVTQRGRLSAAFPLAIRELVRPGYVTGRARVLVMGLTPGVPAEARYELRFVRRGRLRLGTLLLSSRAPLGLVQVTRKVSAPWEVVVFPAVLPVREEVVRARAPRGEGVARQLVFSRERRDMFRNLREMRPGDDLRAIHWRSTARRGIPVVKEFERTGPEKAVVLLELAQEPTNSEAVEAAVTVAASLVAHLNRSGEETGLGIAGRGSSWVSPAMGPAGLERALEELAVTAAGQASELGALVREHGITLADARVFLVTTRTRGALTVPAQRLPVVTARDAEAYLRGAVDEESAS